MEHLHRDDVISFIKECYRVLSPKGILRLVLPDLRINVENYLKSNDADKFIEDLLIQPPKTKTISDLAKLYFSGGCDGLSDMLKAIKYGKASAVAAGSYFVYQLPHRAVMINYPKQKDLLEKVF